MVCLKKIKHSNQIFKARTLWEVSLSIFGEVLIMAKRNSCNSVHF